MKSGVYTAMITPFMDDGTIDYDGFRDNLRFQVTSGVAGIVVLGTTGESPTLEEQEKQEIIKIAVEEVKNKVMLIVGTGSYSTKKTIEDTKKAKDLGADAVLVVTPYYNKPTQEGLYQHFQSVASLEIPIIVYNIPGRAGQNLHTETLKRLAENPFIAGVKEASGNLNQIMDVLEQITRSDFKVFSGDDNLTYPLICLGGHGIISVVSNLIPKEINEMVHLALSGNYDRAKAMHFSLMPFFKTAFIETNPIPIKAMMNHVKMASGPCRLPLCGLSSENEVKIQSLLESVHAYG